MSYVQPKTILKQFTVSYLFLENNQIEYNRHRCEGTKSGPIDLQTDSLVPKCEKPGAVASTPWDCNTCRCGDPEAGTRGLCTRMGCQRFGKTYQRIKGKLLVVILAKMIIWHARYNDCLLYTSAAADE